MASVGALGIGAIARVVDWTVYSGVCSQVCTGSVDELQSGNVGAGSQRVGLSRQFPRHQEVRTEVDYSAARRYRFSVPEPGLLLSWALDRGPSPRHDTRNVAPGATGSSASSGSARLSA